MTASPPVLLTYRTLGLGDLLTAVPALRGLRRAYPDHEHVLAAPAWVGPLVETIDAVDRHLPTGELEQPALDPGSVDVAVNLHGSGPESHRVVEGLHAESTIAFRSPDLAWTAGAPPWCEGEHEVVRWCRLLDGHGIACDPSDLDLEPPDVALPDHVAGATVIHPGAKSGARRWPPDRFADVAYRERKSGRAVVVTGSDEEEPLARAVAWAAGLPDSHVLAGRTDLAGLAAVVGAAGRVICGDTGVAHLATALRTPSVALFGPTSPDEWGPPAERRQRHRVLWAGRRGDPLADQPDPGLLEIQVADVERELETLDERFQRSA